MNAARNILMIGVVLVFLAAPAAGDWNYGEPYKMHFPQLPDPNGWDVAFLHEGNPTRLADDWVCSQTGAVDDIHFWCSWEQDLEYEIFAGLGYEGKGPVMTEYEGYPSMFYVAISEGQDVVGMVFRIDNVLHTPQVSELVLPS